MAQKGQDNQTTGLRTVTKNTPDTNNASLEGYVNVSTITPTAEAPKELIQAFATIQKYLKEEDFDPKAKRINFVDCSVGGVPITSDGMRMMPVNTKAKNGTEDAQNYYRLANRSNNTRTQIIDQVSAMDDGTREQKLSLLIMEYRKQGEEDSTPFDAEVETPEVI